MRLKNSLTVPVLALALVAAVILAGQAVAAVSVGDKAPDFRLQSLTGNSTIRLSSLTTKPTVLTFWVSWCPHCQREMPVLQKIHNSYKDKVNVVGVSVDEDIADARKLLTDQKITFTNAYGGTDEGIEVAKDYGVRGVPATYIIDGRGVVRATFIGDTEESEIRSELTKLGVK